MSGVDFELFVRDCLLAKGYVTIETTPKCGDFGADLIILQDHVPKKIVIQCKRSACAVGIGAVQEVLGARSHYKAAEAWVVSDATFTAAAIKLARSSGVRLKRLVWNGNVRER